MPHPPKNPELATTILTAVRQRLEATVEPGQPLIAAVSGGADSVALAWALRQLHTIWPLAQVVFIDHGFRPNHAERLAAKKAAGPHPFRVVPIQVAPGNRQEMARLARYQALFEIAHETQALVATGHTLSDQAETLLGHLCRGSGIPGLGGLSPRRGRVIRPLLDISRSQTRALGLPFTDDPTNAQPLYRRNRIRQLLEGLAEEQPRIEAHLAQMAEAARASTTLLDIFATQTESLDLRGLDPQLIETLLLHRLRRENHYASAPALSQWAQALSDGEAAAISLGDQLRGMARQGRATVEAQKDPRLELVAPRPGTYRGATMQLRLVEKSEPSAILPHSAELPSHEIIWPLVLRPARASEYGIFGQVIDFESGRMAGGWRVEDATGKPLLPSPSSPHPYPRQRSGGPWLRIEVEKI